MQYEGNIKRISLNFIRFIKLVINKKKLKLEIKLIRFFQLNIIWFINFLLNISFLYKFYFLNRMIKSFVSAFIWIQKIFHNGYIVFEIFKNSHLCLLHNIIFALLLLFYVLAQLMASRHSFTVADDLHLDYVRD